MVLAVGLKADGHNVTLCTSAIFESFITERGLNYRCMNNESIELMRSDVVLEALKQAKVRGIVATGWGGIDAKNLPESLFQIEDAPHDWLFPRMAARRSPRGRRHQRSRIAGRVSHRYLPFFW